MQKAKTKVIERSLTTHKIKTAPAEQFTYVGKSIKRIDGIEKATGSAKFIADIRLPNMLYVKVVRSIHPHAKIKSIDISSAIGVKKIITGVDCNYLVGDCIADMPPIAKHKVRFVGEPVAAVVAETLMQAQLAAEKIKVEYEILPYVIDQREAMKKGSVLIHENLKNYKVLPSFHPIPDSNIFHYYKIRKGNPESAFKSGCRIFENEFIFPHLSHCQLEPHGCIAIWEKTGEIKIWTSAQSPHFVRNTIAEVFKVPTSKIRVIIPYVGGGFGGKSDTTIEPLVVYIAKQLPGYPVRLILTREEMFYGTVIGRGWNIKLKTGIDKTGKIVASEINIAVACGAYGNTGINVVEGGAHNSTGPYEIKNLKVDAYAVYTNTPPIGAFRGYGHPEVHWASERQMDIIAEQLNIDPVELRLKNILRPGSINAFGQKIKKVHGSLETCIKAIVRELKPNEKQTLEEPYLKRGKGIAAMMKSPVMATNAASTAIIQFAKDASANIAVSSTDIGQGSITALSQIAAERLQFPIEKINLVHNADTDFTPYEWQTVASSTTWKVGNAIIAAVEDAIMKMKKIASKVLKVPAAKLEYKKGKIYFKDTKLDIKDIIMGYSYSDGHTIGGPVIGIGYYMPKGLTYANCDTGQGNLAAEWTFACQGAEVEVDIRTGKIRILQLLTAIDAGQIINPLLAKGQIEGAMVQGLGGAIMEEIIYSDTGKIRNDSFVDYKIPNIEDIPDEMKVLFVKTPAAEDTPFGARPLAEHGIVAIAPAIANAIRDACGIHFYKLPMNHDEILRKLKENVKTI